MEEKIQKIQNLLSKLNITVTSEKEFKYFIEAFVHNSFANEHKEYRNYQYLEFLGDALLQYLSTKKIFFEHQNLKEGSATKLRSALVNRETLANLANKLGLVDCMIFTKKSFINGKNDKIDSDLFESFCAALYITKGIDFLMEFLSTYLFPLIPYFLKNELRDPKSEFQEYVQSYKISQIHYLNKEVKNGFESILMVDGQIYGKGFGASKKQAEKEAASNALSKLKK
ncbi:ribonuclease III [[Mycoplasma] anseris]|uniref:Ribonuclease 3 n=1 Tax=[Mycoplasma] anseris TaxID=92400 RepID=A0A2Z4NCY4_9BACT|nr:ribonuclease III [[Mycoplasma] anseris]AWX69428.1 ribonuclease III [[Mycoplasma] anseris]